MTRLHNTEMTVMRRRDFGIAALAFGAAPFLALRAGLAQSIFGTLQGDMERLKSDIEGDITALKEDAREEAAYLLGMLLYVYGYPIVVMDVTREVLTAAPAPNSEGTAAPINQLAKMPVQMSDLLATARLIYSPPLLEAMDRVSYVGVITAIAPAQSRPSRSSRGVYLRTADLFRGADFFRGTPFRVGGLRASLTALPAWNRTALLAAISMVSPVRGFRPSRAGRAAKGSCWQSGGQPGVEQRPALWVLGQEDRDRHGDVVALAALPAGASG